MATNEFLKLTSSPLMNLDHTYRYSGTKLVEEESLSQHMVDTIMMGLKIISKINSIVGDNVLNSHTYVMKAVYHDLEEVITGDIPRPLKYYNSDTRDSLKDVADNVALKLFKEEFPDDPAMHHYIWDTAKSDKEGLILKIVDTLVVANKVVKEVVLLNNFYMLRVAHEVSQYLEEMLANLSGEPHFEDSRIDKYLLSLLRGASDSMDEILISHRKTMKSLNIKGQSMI